MPKKLIALMLLALFLSACGEPEDPRPDKPVAHRRAAFKELLNVFEPMGVMLRTGKYDAKRFQSLSGQLIARRDAPWKHFGADTLYPPSRAKPEVWSDAAKFESHRQAFFDATDKLAGLGGTADQQQAKDAYAAVELSCRNCHKAFKKD